MSLPNQHFLAMFPVQEFLINKDDGAPLSNGYIQFFSNYERTVTKDVYQETYNPNTGEVTFANIGPVITLTSVGTPGDGNGNDIIPFLFPYEGTPEEPGDFEPYFISVYSSDDILQFTRDYWPPNVNAADSDLNHINDTDNMISNPEFVEVLFNPNPLVSPPSYTFSTTGTQSVEIAPGWYIDTVGVGTVTVRQVAISEAIVVTNPSTDVEESVNPAYTLEIDSTSSSLSSLRLRQSFEADPRLFYNNIVSGYFIVSSEESEALAFSMNYEVETGTPTTIEIASGVTQPDTNFYAIGGTVLLEAADNNSTAPDATTDIYITCPISSKFQISCLQLVSVGDINDFSSYLPVSTARQIDHLFHYYKGELAYKPIPSLLVGWDFPLNPKQFYPAPANAIVPNAAYAWDQTICAAAVGSTSTITYDANATTGGFEVTVSNLVGDKDAFYIMQYLDQPNGYGLSGTPLCSNISAFQNTIDGSAAGNAYVRVYLLVANGSGTFPTLPTALGTIDTDGIFTLTAGPNWDIIPRDNLGTAVAALDKIASYANLDETIDKAFSGWRITDSDFFQSRRFAIVVTFAITAVNTIVTVNSASVMKGDIPTRPAPQTPDEVLRECQYYYEKSFPELNPTALGYFSAYQHGVVNYLGSGSDGLLASPFGIIYHVPKVRVPTPGTGIVLYNSSTGTSDQVLGNTYRNVAPNISAAITFSTNWTAADPGIYSAQWVPANSNLLASAASNGSNASSFRSAIYFHYTIDSRLGIA